MDDGRVCGVLAVSRCGVTRVRLTWKLACYCSLTMRQLLQVVLIMCSGTAALSGCFAPAAAGPCCTAAGCSPLPAAAHHRAFGDMEFKGQEGLQLLLQKGIDFELWDQSFADSRWAAAGHPAAARSNDLGVLLICIERCPRCCTCWLHQPPPVPGRALHTSGGLLPPFRAPFTGASPHCPAGTSRATRSPPCPT